MAAYYNETDPFAAQTLRNLIAAGHIAPGEVDERSIAEVIAADVRGFDQCHWFAGIGGWSYALRLAGWPDDRPIWTGSCPCQPFSVAGAGKGHEDERHIWPTWFGLWRELRPAVGVGEQVAGHSGLAWLDAVFADLESAGYAVAAANLCAAGVGAPHKRQRLFWVADADCIGPARLGGRGQDDRISERGGMGDAGGAGLPPRQREDIQGSLWHSEGRAACEPGRTPWSDLEWLACRDGKARPTQPGLFPLAHGVSGRMGRLRGYGNAIVPQFAAAFIHAYLEARQ